MISTCTIVSCIIYLMDIKFDRVYLLFIIHLFVHIIYYL